MWDALEYFEPDGRLGVGRPALEATSGRVLIMDDDPHFLHILHRILSNEKFLVATTSNSCEALRLLQSAAFELVICDLRMPDCDGLNLLQAFRSTGNRTPVIILTAYDDADTYLEAMNAGAAEYLNKPIKSEELVRVVRNCIRKSPCRSNPNLFKKS